MTEKTIPCPYCSRHFKDWNAVRQHIEHKGRKAKSHMEGRRILKLAWRPKGSRDDDEPSLAELAVEATIKRDSGEKLSDLERALLP